MIKVVSILLFGSLYNCQWAYLGGPTDENNLGKYSGSNLWPTSRFNPGFVFDGNEFFLFGGQKKNYFCDLWSLNIETLKWNLLGPSNDPLNFPGSLVDKGKFSSRNWPVPLISISMFTRQNFLYLFPSHDGEYGNYPNFFIYNETSSQWFFDTFQIPVDVIIQEFFLYSNSYFDFSANSFYVIGAEENIYVANMTSLKISVYPFAKYSFPLRYSSTAIDDHSIYIFGGFNTSYFPFNSFFKFNFTSNELVELNSYKVASSPQSNFGRRGTFNLKYFPCGRESSFFQLRKSRIQLIMFGGYNFLKLQVYSDLWIFDLNTTSWAYLAGPTEPNASFKYNKKGVASLSNYPSARCRGASFYDNKMDAFYIFGGQSSNGANNDLWAFYFEPKLFSTFRANSTLGKYSLTSRKELLLSKDTLDASKYSFPVWAIAIITISALLLFSFCLCTLFIKAKDGQKQSTTENTAIKTTAMIETLLNTNIGLSDHLSLQQDSNFFAKVKSLAKGGQAEVVLVKIMNEKLVKECGSNEAVQKIFFNSAKSTEILLHEVSIMAMLRKYLYFVSILAYTFDPLSIVMKYYPEGSLDEWILKNKISRTIRLRFSFEIASALRTMHSHELAHCDIKTQNVLLELIGREPHCCLSDFGITQVLSDSIIAVKTFHVLNLRGISCRYASPESFYGLQLKQSWNFKRSDVYSFWLFLVEHKMIFFH